MELPNVWSEAWIFFRDGLTDELLEIDLLISESPSGVASVTKHPVEVGADVADHVRPEPRALRLECMITNTPIDIDPKPGMSYNDFATPPRFDLDAPVQYSDRAKWADDTLERIREKALLCRVLTSKREYKDMVLTSYDPARTKDTGDALHFALTFERIIKVQTKLVEVKQTAVPGAKVNRGAQPTKTAEAPVEQKASLLCQGLGAMGIGGICE